MSERPPISPRSPRAALEPEQVPPPPKRSERARHPFVVIGNAVITIVLVLMMLAGAMASLTARSIELPFSWRFTGVDTGKTPRERVGAAGVGFAYG